MTYIQYNTNPKSLSGRRIHRLVTHLMISILVSACSPTTSEPGKKSIELDVYEINNDLVKIIIDDEVLSYVHENPQFFCEMHSDAAVSDRKRSFYTIPHIAHFRVPENNIAVF